MKTKKTPYKCKPGNLTRLRMVTIILMIIPTCFYSCKKFVDIPAPTTQLVTSTVFSNDASSTQAVLNIYESMIGLSETLSWQEGLQADELTNYSTNLSWVRIYQNALISSDINNTGIWSAVYPYIYQANAVIQGLQQYKGTTPAIKQQLMGEAYFLRAFFYSYLTNQYGAVPLALTTDYTVNESLARTPRLQILQQIVSDLKQAQSMLNTNYVDASDTTATADRVRPNKAAASALLARAYLYLGDFNNKDQGSYQNAEAAATTVINNANYMLGPLSGANSPFLIDNTEAIWQLATPESGGGIPSSDTPDGAQFILTGVPSTSSARSSTISPELMAAFEPGDQRKTAWIGAITKNGVTYNYPLKYKNRTYAGTEYVTCLRLAEQYLIRAEARAEQGNINGALSDLNVIRTRAGLANYAGAQDQASVLTAILHERQVEFFCEWGHRWFDLNRTGNANAVMSVVTPQKGGTWSTDGHQLLYPLPIKDILEDQNLTQNPGY